MTVLLASMAHLSALETPSNSVQLTSTPILRSTLALLCACPAITQRFLLKISPRTALWSMEWTLAS